MEEEVNEEPTNGEGQAPPVQIANPLFVTTFNAAVCQPCQGCGGIFFLAHPSIVKLMGKNDKGEQIVAGFMCKYCLAQHPELKRQIEPLVIPAAGRFGRS